MPGRNALSRMVVINSGLYGSPPSEISNCLVLGSRRDEKKKALLGLVTGYGLHGGNASGNGTARPG
jgi:hypothetical protein